MREAWLVTRLSFLKSSPFGTRCDPCSPHFFSMSICAMLQFCNLRSTATHEKPVPFPLNRQYAPQQKRVPGSVVLAAPRTLRVLRRPVFVSRIAVVVRANECDYFEQIIGVLDDGPEGGHRPHPILAAGARVAVFLQLVPPERDQAEQGIVIAAVNPGVVGDGRAHPSAARAAVTAAAAVTAEQGLTLRDDVGLRVLVGIFDLSLRRLLDEVERRNLRIVGGARGRSGARRGGGGPWR